MIFVQIVLIALGMGLVLWGADRFTDASTAIARRYRISELVIGLTVVAIGTSLPEFMVSFLFADAAVHFEACVVYRHAGRYRCVRFAGDSRMSGRFVSTGRFGADYHFFRLLGLDRLLCTPSQVSGTLS